MRFSVHSPTTVCIPRNDGIYSCPEPFPSPLHPSRAAERHETSKREGYAQNERDMPKMRPFHTFQLVAPTQHVDLQVTMTTTPQHPSRAPISLETRLKAQNRFNLHDWCHIMRLSMFCHRASGNQVGPPNCTPSAPSLKDELWDMAGELWEFGKELKELKADMASRSVTITPTPQLPTPPVVRTPPSLTWVSSPPSTAPTLLVLPPTLASSVAPPNLNKPLPPLPPTAESPPPTFPTPKPDLGPVVHTSTLVSPKKAPPPHLPSPSITGVVLFSLLLLHYRGSYHWLVSRQPGFSKRLGICPDPEPPPEHQPHSPAIGTGHLSFWIFPYF
jgi:hypothetical protein